MNANSIAATDQDEHLDTVLGAYLAAVDEDRAPDPEGLFATHPDLAGGLTRFFADAERVSGWTAPLRLIAQATRGPQVQRAALGTQLGDYELLEEIGSGGMGVVYKARQRGLDRVVALKMIGAGQFSSALQRQRFRSEAETVAKLDHPRIVPVYEVGEWESNDSGQAVPYFSMKLFTAGSLAQSAARFAVNPAEAARLVAEIAEAVNHAHQRGVLHRDLKPSNILLDGEGRAHVADFGLAKRTAFQGSSEDASLTAPGVLAGTPGYMAPEQTMGQPATTATDTYGLGAILYFLLTERPPFRAGSLLETLEQVRDREPEAPAGLNPRVDRDLQAVCLKCLGKRPEQRYGSAAELAHDLKRWLGGQPTLARPVGSITHLWRWCRRNPGLAGLLTTAVLAVLVAIGSLVAGSLLIWQESRQKDAALEAEQNARRLAEAKERLARRAVDDYMRVAEEWLAFQPGKTEAAREFLQKALAFYEELSREQSADPTVRFRTAQALHFVARIQGRLGQAGEVEQAYRRQIDLLKGLVAEFPGERKYRFDLFHSYQALGLVVGGKNRPGETEELFRLALVVIQDLGRDHQDEPNFRDAEASVIHYLGTLLRARGDYEQAERLLREALQIALQLDREYPERRKAPHFLANAARSLVALGALHWSREAFTKAEDSYRQALPIWEKLVTEHASEPEELAYRQGAMDCRFSLGNLCLERGRAEQAQGWFDQSLSGAERLAREYPRVEHYRIFVAQILTQQAICLQAASRRAEAEAAYRRSVNYLEGLTIELTERHDLKWLLVEQLANFPEERLRDPGRAVALAEAAARQSPNPRALGMTYYRVGRWRESIEELKKEDQKIRRDTLAGRLILAMAYWQNGDKEKGRQSYDSATAWMDEREISAYAERCLQAEAGQLLGMVKPK